MIHPQPPFIPIDLNIDEAMDGTTQAVGRAVELKKVNTQEAGRTTILISHKSTRVRSIVEDLHPPARRRRASGVNGMKPVA